jgi:diguanylate cyclase (GGDEF)-like protein
MNESNKDNRAADLSKVVPSDIASEMGITAEEVALRKEFLEFSEADSNLLRGIHEHIASLHIDESFADLFYHHLLSFPELRKLIPDDATLDKLKAVQSQYFRRLTAGEYDEDYVLDRLRVGCIHQRIGLEPRWYTGAYRKYLSFLLSILHEIAGGDGQKLLAYYDALLKVVFFDMELALDTYFHSDRQALRHMANHDALTGLPNRYLLNDRIEQAIHQAHRDGNKVAILFIDLDRFKNINDSLGHPVGDKVISEVSARFTASLREGDTIARIGGDEFVVVLTSIERDEQVTSAAVRLLGSIELPVQANATELFITASMGIATYPVDGKNQDELLKNADTAMYLAKREGGNTFRFYRREMNLLSVTRLNLDARLRQALKKHEFMLHYQPQVDTESGQIVGVEALLRWEPNGVPVLPADFVSLIEETGLIVPVGEWVLDAACRQAVAWHDAGIAPIRVAVNISARQFLGQDVVELVSRTLAKTGCKPSWLELEITESAVMKTPEESAAKLRRLAEMGVTISIDDFGTGYSSLAYLKQFPAHALKIDRSFIQNIGSDLGDSAIVQAVIALAHGLNIKVVGEGVEHEGQLALLRDFGCDLLQGYYFSRPLPAHEATQLLLRTPVLAAKDVRRNASLASNEAPA